MRFSWIGAVGIALPLGLIHCDGAPDYVECVGACCYGYECPLEGGDGGALESGAGVQPMLVEVETGKTLTASPGKGVGVFLQYAAGGHWTMWWTCDSELSGAPCSFRVSATTRRGEITNIAGYDGTTLTPPEGGCPDGGLDAGGSIPACDSGDFEAGTENVPTFPILGQVTDQIQGITFDAEPGAIVEVTAQLGTTSPDGQLVYSNDAKLFYFVDQGKVKDGYKGPLTDPLLFEPTSP